MLSGWLLWLSSLTGVALLAGAAIGLVRLRGRARNMRERSTQLGLGSACLALISVLFLNSTWISPGISQGLGIEAIRSGSLALFLASIAGIVLSLIGAGRLRILSGAVCVATGAWWFILVMSAAISMGAPLARHPVRFLIPDGYVGWVHIVFGVKNVPPLPKDKGVLICRVPDSGVLLTSSQFEEGWASDTYTYYRSNGSEQRLTESSWGGGGMIWGTSTQVEGTTPETRNSRGISQLFYVGTEEQFKHAGPGADFKPVKIVP